MRVDLQVDADLKVDLQIDADLKVDLQVDAGLRGSRSAGSGRCRLENPGQGILFGQPDTNPYFFFSTDPDLALKFIATKVINLNQEFK